MAYDEEIASAMMEQTGEEPMDKVATEEASNDGEIVANVADELSSLTGKEIDPDQIQQLVDAIIEDKDIEEETPSEEKPALPDDFA